MASTTAFLRIWLLEAAHEPLPVDALFVPAVEPAIDDADHFGLLELLDRARRPRRRSAAGSSRRLADAQVPLAQQAHLLLGVALSIMRLTKFWCFFCSSPLALALKLITGSRSSVLENIFFSITARSFS